MAEDRYANIMSGAVQMSAANTITFLAINTGVGLQSKQGMLIDQIDYYPTGAAIAEMTTAVDNLQFALTVSNGVTNLFDFTDRRVVHSSILLRADFGTAAAAELVKLPIVNQFFPPLIVAEPTLYFAADTVGLASAALIRFRVYFRFIDLTDRNILEIAQSFVLVG